MKRKYQHREFPKYTYLLHVTMYWPIGTLGWILGGTTTQKHSLPASRGFKETATKIIHHK